MKNHPLLQFCLLTILSTASIASQPLPEFVQIDQTGSSVAAYFAVLGSTNSIPLVTTQIAPETWDVSLAFGSFQLAGTQIGEQISWDAPPNATGYEVLTVLNTTTLEYQSGVPNPEGAGPIILGGSSSIGPDINGNPVSAEVSYSVPEKDTATLLALGSAGLWLLHWTLTSRKDMRVS